jgi:hypothetical protein
MSRTVAKLAAIPFLLVLSAASSVSGERVGEAIIEIRRDLLEGRVGAITVYAVPYDVRTRTRLTPSLLRESAAYVFSPDLTDDIRKALAGALERTKADSTDTEMDLRWGVVFMEPGGREIHSLFLSGSSPLGAGRYGVVDGETVKLNRPLAEWLEGSFPLRQPQR